MRSMSEMRKILPYFRNARVNLAAGDSRSTAGVSGFMLLPSLLEYAGDDLVQRRILNANVDDFVPVENGAEHVTDLAPLHLQIRHRPLPAGHVAEAVEVGGRVFADKMELDELGAAELLGDARQRAVVDEFAGTD